MIGTTINLLFATFACLCGASAQNLPKVTLPWGTYQALLYDPAGDFYTFSDIRFGKAPIGELRFQKSGFPDSIADPSQILNDEGASCYAAAPLACPKQTANADLAATVFGPPHLLPTLPKKSSKEPSEDCLFADLYVPASALNGTRVPIVVWLYGGGFIFGAKDAGFGYNMPFYNATGLLRTAHAQSQDFILITGNYRMGAFGWLAGPTMEQYGTPNAGLWDQRLLLDFAHQFGYLFGGDGGNIGIWGESAGGGSILHHLTSTEPPVFRRALMQSPAYLWQWDRSEQGYAAKIFGNLSEMAGCPSTGAEAISCLQDLDDTALQQLNEAMITQEINNTGLIPFNPAVDGSLITQLPTTAFRQGAVWKDVTSFIVSHVADEGKSFVPCYLHDDNDFQNFLYDIFSGDKYIDQRQAINDQYGEIKDPRSRAQAVISDSSFLCNTRFVYDAYSSASSMYMMQYDFLDNVGGAVHASDLLPTFYNADVPEHDFYVWFNKTIRPGASEKTAKFLLARVKSLAGEFQPYLASFAAAGAPKPNAAKGSPEWSVAEADDMLGNVMQVSWHPFSSDMRNNTVDTQNTKTVCDFWVAIARSVQRTAQHRIEVMIGQQATLKTDL